MYGRTWARLAPSVADYVMYIGYESRCQPARARGLPTLVQTRLGYIDSFMISCQGSKVSISIAFFPAGFSHTVASQLATFVLASSCSEKDNSPALVPWVTISHLCYSTSHPFFVCFFSFCTLPYEYARSPSSLVPPLRPNRL